MHSSGGEEEEGMSRYRPRAAVDEADAAELPSEDEAAFSDADPQAEQEATEAREASLKAEKERKQKFEVCLSFP